MAVFSLPFKTGFDSTGLVGVLFIEPHMHSASLSFSLFCHVLSLLFLL